MLIIVGVDFVFVLVKFVLQLYGTSYVSLKLHCKNKFAWIVSSFLFQIMNSKVHQSEKIIITNVNL
jgi:hypothetical protein